MDRKVFFDMLRPNLNWTTGNVFGAGRHLDYIEEHQVPVNIAAYALATSWWETAQTLQPVREAWWMSEAWRKRNLRYHPFYGRGLIQVTWLANAKKLGALLGLGDELVKKPDRMLDWDVALPALFRGMEVGLYTGRKLGDIIDELDEGDDEDRREYIRARRVVNGTDKALTIANLAVWFEGALRLSGYEVKPPVDPVIRPTLGSTTTAQSADLKYLSQTILKMGMTGEAVRMAQQLLNQRGYSLVADGIYGKKTQQSVEDFQTKWLTEFGQVGPSTWAALIKTEDEDNGSA